MATAGKRLRPWQTHVNEYGARQWAALLNDENPIHANAVGAVNPGPANMSYLMTLLRRAFPTGQLQVFESRFVAPVFVPATVEATGVVKKVEATLRGELYHCQLELRCAGTVAVTAHAQVLIPAIPHAEPS